MMFKRAEIIVGMISVVCIVFAFLLVQSRPLVSAEGAASQATAVQAGLVNEQEELMNNENQQNMNVQDIKVGTGSAVEDGDTVVVHYSGRLENGQEFDNSQKRGAPLEFTVGAGQVIAGWEQGLLGMKVGGERVLNIPPELAYGEQGIGPIPGGATLTFTIELLEIK